MMKTGAFVLLVVFIGGVHAARELKQGLAVNVDPGDFDSCFPESSTVLLESGARKAINDVVVGDRVASAVGSQLNGDNAKIVFSEVIAFLDAEMNHATPIKYMKFNVQGEGEGITMTPTHLLYSAKGSGPLAPVAARYVEVGDWVLAHTAGGVARKTKVTGIENMEYNSKFAPLTMAGNVIVDGLVASCYNALVPHSLAHAGLAPLRALYRARSMVGIGHSASQCGWHWYAAALYQTHLWRPVTGMKQF